MRTVPGLLRARVVVCLLLAGFGLPALAADAAKKPAPPPEKETPASIQFEDPASHDVRTLPSQVPFSIGRPAAFYPPLGPDLSEKHMMGILEPASSFRVKRGKELDFVVRCGKRESFLLMAFPRRQSTREAQVSRHQLVPLPFYIQNHRFHVADDQPMFVTVRDEGIPFDAKATGEDSYRFVVQDLPPGEYGFVMAWSFTDDGVPAGYQVFDFAVAEK